MKLEEWKEFLDLIPDNDYTRKLEYTYFQECETIKAGDPGSVDCFVTIDGQETHVRCADSKKGVIKVMKDPIELDETGDVVSEYKKGDVKIVKYGYNFIY